MTLKLFIPRVANNYLMAAGVVFKEEYYQTLKDLTNEQKDKCMYPGCTNRATVREYNVGEKKYAGTCAAHANIAKKAMVIKEP